MRCKYENIYCKMERRSSGILKWEEITEDAPEWKQLFDWLKIRVVSTESTSLIMRFITLILVHALTHRRLGCSNEGEIKVLTSPESAKRIFLATEKGNDERRKQQTKIGPQYVEPIAHDPNPSRLSSNRFTNLTYFL